MDIKKIIIAGVLTTIISTILDFLTCGGFFNWVYQLEPTNVWKPMTGMTGSWFALVFLGGLFFNFILAWVYMLLYKAIPGDGIKKGFNFGILVWLVGISPGLFAIYMTMTVATIVIVYWWLFGFIQLLIFGGIIAMICSPKVEGLSRKSEAIVNEEEVKEEKEEKEESQTPVFGVEELKVKEFETEKTESELEELNEELNIEESKTGEGWGEVAVVEEDKKALKI